MFKKKVIRSIRKEEASAKRSATEGSIEAETKESEERMEKKKKSRRLIRMPSQSYVIH